VTCDAVVIDMRWFRPDGLTGVRGRRNIDDVIDVKAALADIANALATKFEHGGTDAASRLAAIHVAAIERWAPVGSSYRSMLSKVDPFDARDRGYTKVSAILDALRRDYEQGQVKTLEQLVHAGLFGDLLKQGDALREAGYLLPAAVIAGAALEEHIRLMAIATGSIALEEPDRRGRLRPREASALREDLYAKAHAMTAPERTQVQAWMDLRNEAAHNLPTFQTRTDGDVERMISGVREFIVRHPA
jgi:hypothetical protein